MTNFVCRIVLTVSALLVAGCGDGIAKDGSSGGGSTIFGLKVDGARPVRRIFVTQTVFSGNLNGPAGADAACMADAARPVGGGSYKALLTDGRARVACLTTNCVGQGATEHVDWVLAPDMQYVRPDGTFIGIADELGLLAFPLLASISTSATAAWTGLKDNYTASIYTCQHFASSANAYGNVGTSNAVNGRAIDTTFGSCGLSRSALYCVEQ